jgi:hypothetical protein
MIQNSKDKKSLGQKTDKRLAGTGDGHPAKSPKKLK